MKKKSAALAAAAVFCAVSVTASGCGSVTNETGDREAPAYSAPDATIALSGKVGGDEGDLISEDLFGLFLEDINYASQALDDNLVANGSFEAGSAFIRWREDGVICDLAEAGGVFSSNGEFGEVNAKYAALETFADGTLINEGYDAVPMAVTEGTKYVFSAFLKAEEYAGEVVIEVTDGTSVYASSAITVQQSANWVKYRTTLTASASASEGLFLRLTFSANGRLGLDCVQLETGDSVVGIKRYLYDAIADLSPAFFRFPGGCAIEGKSGEKQYYDWKDSVGAVALNGDDGVPAFTYSLNEDGTTSQVTTYGEWATRTPDGNIWGLGSANGSAYYEMEYGVGFYEYFLLCDSLGAKAVPILNCGMSCMIQDGGNRLAGRHGNGVDDFIRDALDLVAFAKGDPDSEDEDEAYWAGIRVAMGHEEPFEMDYLGIGNEQWGNYYTRYYEAFVKAFIEAKKENPLYGTVELIVGNGALFTDCQNSATGAYGLARTAAETFIGNGKLSEKLHYIDNVSEYGVHDQHYYVHYTDLLANTGLYDDYIRPEESEASYYHVFVGEYSANQATALDGGSYGFVANSWITALSEAAMMTGYERNGDVVRMAAYAPMFGNLIQPEGANGVQWAVNMMFFDESEVRLTPNYYIQQLFMQNCGDRKLSSSYEGTNSKMTYTAGSLSQTLDSVYYVTSYDSETGDVVIKIVNAGDTAVDLNVKLGLSLRLRGYAEVIEYSGYEPTDTYSTAEFAAKRYSIGSFGGDTFGYTAKEYSATVIRVKPQ